MIRSDRVGEWTPTLAGDRRSRALPACLRWIYGTAESPFCGGYRGLSHLCMHYPPQPERWLEWLLVMK